MEKKRITMHNYKNIQFSLTRNVIEPIPKIEIDRDKFRSIFKRI